MASDRPHPRARRVLVADDSPDGRQALALVLRLLGYEVAEAANGPAALAAAPAFRPDAAVLDLAMPGMDGLELARRLRELPGLGEVVLVAVTGHPHLRQPAAEAGFAAYLLKPCDLPELQAAIGPPCVGTPQ
jgi:CheY-like chemotaxis protein